MRDGARRTPRDIDEENTARSCISVNPNFSWTIAHSEHLFVLFFVLFLSFFKIVLADWDWLRDLLMWRNCAV